MLPLSAGLDASELVLDRILDGLIVAELEMQERMMFYGTPMAAEQGVRADEIDGSGDPTSVSFRHHQQDAIPHLLADDRVERSREIGSAPFARAGLHVELEEMVPHAFGEVRAGQPMHGDVAGERILAFAP